MPKRKWLVSVVVVSVLMVGGIVGGLVVAADDSSSGNDDEGQVTDRYQALLDRACAIYQENTGVAIDPEQLRDAFKQAHEEMRDEALGNWLQKLVDEGKLTQEQADEYLEWWQSRPDTGLPLPGLGGPALKGGIMWRGGFGRWGHSCPGPADSGQADS